eukprot:scaffold158447_cov34-Tisochrysis_lutea.AAC.2
MAATRNQQQIAINNIARTLDEITWMLPARLDSCSPQQSHCGMCNQRQTGALAHSSQGRRAKRQAVHGEHSLFCRTPVHFIL